jgi:peptide subunit release factor 1 (eRF1)
MDYERRSVPRHRLAAALPSEGSDGSSHYRPPGDAPTPRLPVELQDVAEASETGHAAFITADSSMVVLPPFPLDVSTNHERIVTAPLVENVEHDRTCAVFLLRLGGFAVGVLDGDALLDSKVDQRFVKNRHRKGGQSQRRFERIREKQIDELFKKACETAREKLSPHDDAIEHVFLGGDKRTLQAFGKRCDYFDSFGERLLSRVLPVAGDPRHDTLIAIPRALYACDVYTVRLPVSE